MISFILCLALLIIGYFTYGKVLITLLDQMIVKPRR